MLMTMRRTLEATSLLMTLACWGLIAPDVEAAETQEIGAEASASLTADEDELEAEGSSDSSDTDSSGSSGSSSDSSGSSDSSSGNMGDLSGKKLRLHLESDVLSVTMQTNGGNTITDIGFGVGRPTAPDGVVLAGGFAQPLLSIGLGAIILDGHGAVGGQAAMSLDAVPNGGGVLIGGHVIGYFNYMFDTYGRIKPFVGGRLGFGGASLGGGGVIYPLIGAQGGIHLFLLEPVSLDFALALDYAPLIATGGGGLAFHAINISVPRIGLSTWF